MGGDQEGELGMDFCEGYEALYGLSGANQAFHCGNGVGSALEALAVTPLCSEMIQRISGRTSGVVTLLVGAEYKDLAGLQGADMFGGYSLVHVGWGCCHKDMIYLLPLLYLIPIAVCRLY